MSEQRGIRHDEIRPDFPAKVVELLSRPRLNDLPENPVGKVLETLRGVYAGYDEATLPEIIDVAAARATVANDAMYVEPGELQHVDERRILRYDLTLPLLLSVRYEGAPLRLWAAGKTYRVGRVDAMHLEAFHQLEIFCLDDRSRVDRWQMTGQVLQSVNALLPGRAVKVVPTQYAMCSDAWELEVDNDGQWSEVIAFGVFTDRIVEHLGGNPRTHTAIGVGYGLERLAMIRYGIDDARKVEGARVA